MKIKILALIGFISLVLGLLLFPPQEIISKYLSSGGYTPTTKKAYFHGQIMEAPQPYEEHDPQVLENEYALEIEAEFEESSEAFLSDSLVQADVLGKKSKKKSSGEKVIKVDLSTQTLYAYEGDKRKYKFKISSGKWWPTPTGEYRVQTKLKYTTMSGGSKALGTYYYLPNVPFTMYFYQGYAIHGAYWHSNFGQPMSHGCINMKPSEAEVIFNWAKPKLSSGNSIRATKDSPGTKIIIYGKAPK